MFPDAQDQVHLPPLSFKTYAVREERDGMKMQLKFVLSSLASSFAPEEKKGCFLLQEKWEREGKFHVSHSYEEKSASFLISILLWKQVES